MKPGMDDLTRIYDALTRLYADMDRSQVRRILIVGPDYPCQPCDRLVTLFPAAHLSLVELDRETAGKLHKIEGERITVHQGDAASGR